MKYFLIGSFFAVLGLTQCQNGSRQQNTPSRPPAQTVVPAMRSIRDVTLAVAKNQVRELNDGRFRTGSLRDAEGHVPPKGIMWEYTWGVTLYGLLRVSEATHDRLYADYVLKRNVLTARYFSYLQWMKETYPDAYRKQQDWKVTKNPLFELTVLDRLDFCGAMGAEMLEGFMKHGAKPTAEEEQLVGTIADYINHRQPRMPDGTFWRPVFTNPYIQQANPALDRTLWIDDLYMACPFLVRWAQYSGDSTCLDDAANQVIRMAERQQDGDGLWFHGNFIGENKRSAYKWGRGNGWAMVATVEVLSVLPENHPKRPRLLKILSRHVDGIKTCQAASGLWHQVLDHPELWEETSCSAMFSYAIARAVRRGWIGASFLTVARLAFEGVSRNVTAEGLVNGTCEGTEIGRDLEYYANRGRPVDDRHGQGAVLLAGAELIEIESP